MLSDREYLEEIRKHLDDKRYYHSVCVADEAKKLAVKYGGDEKRAYTAGILHDITKQTDKDKQLQIISQSGIIKVTETEGYDKILHSKSGAAYIHDVLGVDDDEIITAVRYHTTARAGMSLLEKILYIADFTSADRDYSDISVMRVLSRHSLEEAMKYALCYTVKDLAEQRKPIHTDTLFAYNYYIVK